MWYWTRGEVLHAKSITSQQPHHVGGHWQCVYISNLNDWLQARHTVVFYYHVLSYRSTIIVLVVFCVDYQGIFY